MRIWILLGLLVMTGCSTAIAPARITYVPPPQWELSIPEDSPCDISSLKVCRFWLGLTAIQDGGSLELFLPVPQPRECVRRGRPYRAYPFRIVFRVDQVIGEDEVHWAPSDPADAGVQIAVGAPKADLKGRVSEEEFEAKRALMEVKFPAEDRYEKLKGQTVYLTPLITKGELVIARLGVLWGHTPASASDVVKQADPQPPFAASTCQPTP